jgi:threonine aldolase
MIDLYSDTVTRPTPGMRRAMAEAEVGDEQRGLDPTTNALQERVALLLGKEAAIFLPSATMANLIACRLHTRPGEAVVLDARCHILNSEAGGLAVHSGLVPRPVAGDRGRFTPEQVREQLQTPTPVRPATTLLACEQTHNAGGGAIWTTAQLMAVCGVAREAGLKTHLDGARLFNAAIAAGVSAAEFAGPFDTAMICLSKGLGAPTGAVLAGTQEAIQRARVLKQLFGGAMRQSGVLAAAALYALDHHIERLAVDHANAGRLAAGLTAVPTLDVEPVETNIVCVGIERTGLTAPELISRLQAAGVSVSASARCRVRLVTHLDVTAADVDRAVAIIGDVLACVREARTGNLPAAVG